jgi:hypothetical protein
LEVGGKATTRDCSFVNSIIYFSYRSLGMNKTEPIVNKMLADTCKTAENVMPLLISMTASKVKIKEPIRNNQLTSNSRSKPDVDCVSES